MMNIKEWFLNKEFTPEEKFLIAISKMETLKVTEKAICIQFNNDERTFTKWIPKSCLMTREEMAEKETAREESFSQYDKFKDFAKSKGIAVRSNTTKKTLHKKLREIDALSEAISLGLTRL